MLSDDGRCKNCPIGTRASDDGSKCEPSKCDLKKGEVLLDDGTCFVVAKKDPKKDEVICKPNEYKKDKKCTACEDYTKPIKDLTACKADECDARSVNKKDGTCKSC